jgi:hypothetical protein
MLKALCERLLEKLDLYQDEMVVFLWHEFRILQFDDKAKKSSLTFT